MIAVSSIPGLGRTKKITYSCSVEVANDNPRTIDDDDIVDDANDSYCDDNVGPDVVNDDDDTDENIGDFDDDTINDNYDNENTVDDDC